MAERKRILVNSNQEVLPTPDLYIEDSGVNTSSGKFG